MKKTTAIQLLIVIMILFLPAILHAQPIFIDEVDDVPIDGGLSLLAAAGVGYGARKLKTYKQKTQNQQH